MHNTILNHQTLFKILKLKTLRVTLIIFKKFLKFLLNRFMYRNFNKIFLKLKIVIFIF